MSKYKITTEQRVLWARKDPRQTSLFGYGHERELINAENDEGEEANPYIEVGNTDESSVQIEL